MNPQKNKLPNGTQNNSDGTGRGGITPQKGRTAMAMTMKQKLEMHKKIVQSNARKLREWKQKGGKRS